MNPFLVILRFVLGLWTNSKAPARPAFVRVSATRMPGGRKQRTRPEGLRIPMQRGGRLTFPTSFLRGASFDAFDPGSSLSFALAPWRRPRRRR